MSKIDWSKVSIKPQEIPNPYRRPQTRNLGLRYSIIIQAMKQLYPGVSKGEIMATALSEYLRRHENDIENDIAVVAQLHEMTMEDALAALYREEIKG